MAYTKIHAIKTTLNKALDYIENPEKATLMTVNGYITNPDKTDGQLLVSGYNVDPLTASVEMTVTQAMAKQMMGEHGAKLGTPALAYHMIQSFEPGEVTPEKAHELGKRLANELLEGKYEYVIATHVDKAHIHNHIIFNATSFYDFKKFRSRPGITAGKIRAISDRICAEADLSVIKTPQQMGRSYQYKSQKYGPSWKSQISRRLKFVLQTAESWEDFVDGAARLGVAVDATGKYVKYRMEGQERVTRDRALDSAGAYSVEGVKEQISANTDARVYLKQAIREAAAATTNCKDFRAELQKRGVSVKETRRFGLSYTVEDTVVREWALGPAYSAKAIQAFLDRVPADVPPFTETGAAMDNIAEEFLKTNQSHATEVGVAISRSQILKTTADGVLISVPGKAVGEEQLAFIDHNHVVYHRETDSFTAYIGNGYDYHVADADGQRTGSRLKGENMIRALELGNGVRPRQVEIPAQDVKYISPKGLTLSIPEQGIGSLFVENAFMEYDRSGNGTAKADIYENWSYRFDDTSGSVKYLSGHELTELLEKRCAAHERSLTGRINSMRRRQKLADIHQMAEHLQVIGRYNIESFQDFDSRLAELRQKQVSIQASIEALRERNAAYKAVAKYLTTYTTFKPVQLKAMQLSGSARRSYEANHKGELAAWSAAARELDKRGIMPEVEPEKVLELVREQDRQIDELKQQSEYLAEREVELENAKSAICEIRQEYDHDFQPEPPQQEQDQEL